MSAPHHNGDCQLILDRAYSVVQADSRFARYQEQLGGGPNTVCKIAELVDLAKLAGKLDMRIHRGIRFRVDEANIKCWADILPDKDGFVITLTDIEETFDSDVDSKFDAIKVVDSDGWLHIDHSNVILGGELPGDIADKGSIEDFVGAIWPALLRPIDDTDFAEKIARGSIPVWQVIDNETICFWPFSKAQWNVKIIPSDDQRLLTWHFSQLQKPDTDTRNDIEALALPVVDTPHKRLFIHSVAPALRAPVVRIMANARTISEEKNGPLRNQYAGYAEDIAQAAEHLLALIDDASDLEAVDGDDFHYVSEDVDLCDVAKRAAGLLRVKAQSRAISITTPSPDDHIFCRAEFRRTLQIVLNLLSNAIRYGPENAEISIHVEQINGMARLIVSDMGKGISREEQAVIFDKFERLGRSGDGGSGLGLYISRRLARAMGGDILIESAPEKGARFTLELPMKE